jgi:hypothetical protein
MGSDKIVINRTLFQGVKTSQKADTSYGPGCDHLVPGLSGNRSRCWRPLCLAINPSKKDLAASTPPILDNFVMLFWDKKYPDRFLLSSRLW